MVFILRLAINDLKNIIRDRMFIFLFIGYPIMLILFSRILVHLIAPRIENMFPLAANYPLILMFFIVIIPFIFSFIAAFLILDERDEHLLTVLRVMPISRNSYLIYRMFFMSLFAFITLLIFPQFSGLIEGMKFSFLAYIPTALLFAILHHFVHCLLAHLQQIKYKPLQFLKSEEQYFYSLFLHFYLI